jgi:NAD(P)-dependent dehydrogenase (short-subunit alcohol dehydrogenase family)
MSAPPVAIVTGGAGGIGAAVCARLAKSGYRLVVADLDLDGAQRVAGECGGTAVRMDVADPEDNRAMVARALDEHGRLDVLVLNAGVASDVPPDPPLDLERYRRAMGVNVDGVVFGIDAGLAALQHTGGQIAVTASLAGLGPEAANPVYALGKTAIVGYVRALARPLALRGVRINAICPSFVDTEILGIAKRLMRKQRFPLLTPDEVAEAVATIVAGEASGEAWAMVAGRPAAPFTFTEVPTTLLPDGTEVSFKPFLSKA